MKASVVTRVPAAVLVLTFSTLASASLAGAGEGQREAAARVADSARRRGLSEEGAQRALAVLDQLSAGGLPVGQAADVVGAALQASREARDIETIGLSTLRAYEQGAPSQELVNLTEDLATSGVPPRGIVVAIEAVGRLAEDGQSDPETRRSVALAALEARRDGERGEDLSETVRDEVQGRSGDGSPRDAQSKESDGESLRDDLRREPPADMPPSGRGPAAAPGRGEGQGGGRDTAPGQNKPDKGPDDGNPGQGPPDVPPGQGGEIPGKGPPEGSPGQGPPDTPPRGPPEDNPGGGNSKNPGRGNQ